jgi:hypothetical protein
MFSPLARDLSISQHAQLLAILRKMRNSLDRMEHAEGSLRSSAFVIEPGVPSAQLIFSPALLINKGRNNGSQKTF